MTRPTRPEADRTEGQTMEHLPVKRCRRRCRFISGGSRFLITRTNDAGTIQTTSLAYLNVCERCGYAYIDSPHPDDLTAFFDGAHFDHDEWRGRISRLEGALRELVELKDGPRDRAYEERKPRAWRRARQLLLDTAR